MKRIVKNLGPCQFWPHLLFRSYTTAQEEDFEKEESINMRGQKIEYITVSD